MKVKFYKMWLKSIVIMPILWFITDAARILGVFLEPSISHQASFRPLLMELARRGHEVIVFTPIPVSDSIPPNYTQVELRYSLNDIKLDFDYYFYNMFRMWILLHEVAERNEKIFDAAFSNPILQKFISPNSTEKFDLIITECLLQAGLYALPIRLKAPLIGMSSIPPMTIQHYIFGNPILTAYSPLVFSGNDDNMNLWERLTNTLMAIYELLWYRYTILPRQERMVRKHFGDDMPPIHELSSNIELYFGNFHPFLYPRANVPAIIPIRGHRKINRKKRLPQDLEEMLNKEKKGFIYFSLGSYIKSDRMPIERRNTLLRTFAKLPYKILWKFESDDLADKPNNVMIRKWFPQQEILAHPNIRLFIYQGGLQSTEEAMANGVPLIGFPIFTDQYYNVKQLQSLGIGKQLSLNDVNEDVLRETIFEIISNSSYKENMLKLRDLLRDLPYDPLDNAIWWTEHVIRHKGAPHLRNKSRNMPWYQVQLLDIMAITLVGIVLVGYIFVTIFRFLRRIVTRTLKNTMRTKYSEKKQR